MYAFDVPVPPRVQVFRLDSGEKWILSLTGINSEHDEPVHKVMTLNLNFL